MTNFKITGNKVQITEAMEAHVKKKFEKIIENSSGQITYINVHFSKNNNSTDAFKISAEVHVKGTTFHADETGDSGEEFYSLTDTIAQNIERQINKRKIRFESEKKRAGGKRDQLNDVEYEDENEI